MADLGPKRIARFTVPFRVAPGRKVRLPQGCDPAGLGTAAAAQKSARKAQKGKNA